MSKPSSGYFTNTSGAGKALIAEVQARGDKITLDDVIGIAKDKSGKIIWLEKGTLDGRPSGLKHIIDAHEENFNSKGITTADIADFVLIAVTEGEIIGYQGKGTSRPIYQVTYNGKEYKVAVTVGNLDKATKIIINIGTAEKPIMLSHEESVNWIVEHSI